MQGPRKVLSGPTRRTLATATVVVALVAAPGTAPLPDGLPVAHRDPPLAHGVRRVMALGDSVTAGAACGCAAFPTLYGRLLERGTDRQVLVTNDGVDGLDTAGLVAQLDDHTVATAVAAADVVVVTIGANDFEDEHDAVTGGTCAEDAGDCATDELGTMRTGLGRALAEVTALRRGRPTTVLVTGYWNVFEDGEVQQRESGDDGVRSSRSLTLRVNTVIREVSRAGGAHYVDLFGPFQSRGGQIDDLLAPDGDHPSASGHAVIARALIRAGLPR